MREREPGIDVDCLLVAGDRAIDVSGKIEAFHQAAAP